MLIAAFALLFMILLAVGVTRILASGTGDIDRGLRESAESLLVGIEPVETEDAVQAVFRMFEHLQQNAAGESDQPISHIIAIRLSDGRWFATKGTPDLDPAIMKSGVQRLRVGNDFLRGFKAQGQRWAVIFLDQEEVRQQAVMADTALELAAYMAIALPLLVVPVWLSVRTGMKPLSRLSSQIAERDPADLSPVRSVGNYAELTPLEQALNMQFSMAADRIRRERAFVQDAAHELRTPLAVIATQAHVLAVSEGTSRLAALRNLEQAVQRSSHLVKQLLSLARADASTSVANEGARRMEGSFDLMDLLQDTLALLEPAANSVQCELSLEGPDRAPMRADEELIRSVIVNLVDNALKYGSSGGMVEVSLAQDETHWTLSVADRGPGVKGDAQKMAFERFWRGPDQATPGTGLGLAIVREVLNGLGGEARLSEHPGGGCLATARWPTARTSVGGPTPS